MLLVYLYGVLVFLCWVNERERLHMIMCKSLFMLLRCVSCWNLVKSLSWVGLSLPAVIGWFFLSGKWFVSVEAALAFSLELSALAVR